MSDPTQNSDSRGTSRTLLARARERQAGAWDRLVLLYGPLVRHWCRRGGVAPQDIDDVMQEVFANAFASLESFRHGMPGDSFRGWLRGVTRHRLLEHFRRLRRHLAAAGGTDAQALIREQPDLNVTPDGEEQDLCNQLHRRLLELIRNEFEQTTWDMFWRSVIDGVPTEMIAGELGVTSAAVRQARSRVLRRLREETADLDP
jgi:RNA polymerase sigma-70 factor (ECF subfamily)